MRLVAQNKKDIMKINYIRIRERNARLYELMSKMLTRYGAEMSYYLMSLIGSFMSP